MIEAVEDARQLIGCDTDSMIFDRNSQPIFLFFKVDFDVAAVRTEFDGVIYKGSQRALQRFGIAMNGQYILFVPDL